MAFRSHTPFFRRLVNICAAAAAAAEVGGCDVPSIGHQAASQKPLRGCLMLLAYQALIADMTTSNTAAQLALITQPPPPPKQPHPPHIT
jgi:hypothetical protein